MFKAPYVYLDGKNRSIIGCACNQLCYMLQTMLGLLDKQTTRYDGPTMTRRRAHATTGGACRKTIHDWLV